jgi:NADPH2:quinone reductase
MKAIRLHSHGGPDRLRLEEVPAPTVRDGELLVRVAAAGVNYSDVYQRSGLTAVALPSTLGSEGVGTVADGNGDFPPGTRVAWAPHPGSYAEWVSVPAWKLVRVPDALDDVLAAAALLQGMTAQFLCETTYPAKKGDVALVHAGAGGVGLLLTQLLKHKGVTVFSTVSTAEKARLAREAGADDVILYTQTDFVSAVRAATDGKGVNVVYDSVGQATYAGSLSLLRPLGMLVLFGQSSGLVPPIDPLLLMKQGSVFVTRPTLAHYIADPAVLQERAAKVFGWIRDGVMKLRIGGVYPLADAARAHADLESRATTGKLVLQINGEGRAA